MESSLSFENKLVLDTVQAALGLISPEMRAISIVVESSRVVVHVAVHESTAQVVEDVEDLVFELQALQEKALTVESVIFEGPPHAGWSGNSGRRIYVAKNL
jgi:hypothetical protein